MNEFAENIAKTLRAARQAAGLTQQDMAAQLGVCRSTYTYYETGRTQPDLESLAKICRVLGVSADSLLGLDAPGNA